MEALLLSGLPPRQALDEEVEAADSVVVTPIPDPRAVGAVQLPAQDPDWHPVWAKDFVKRGEAYLDLLVAARDRAGEAAAIAAGADN